ncbi:hypothetical protein CANARDRAFT_8444 [[Candida] arabinofermentans NRRL YB-2248]|uniref:Nucleoporin POM152 n=1 Tax=[Candida] arabinofermentans NRRL YB-2248 TaxID=983967 RepID=A0A1E4SY84_9ASCO|nr:hypothetical protein CANARDRAFT_8444 [[Candida] arabinofermentans NRRL YB-2248]
MSDLKKPVSDKPKEASTTKVIPLIPERVLDVTTQRISLVSIFALIQAWKIYDLCLIKNDSLRELVNADHFINFISPEWNFIFKYMFWDGLVIWLNSILRIPKLVFKPTTSIALIVVLYSLTFLLTLHSSVPSITIFSTIWAIAFPEKELAILESYVDSNGVVDQSSHFKGKKTIRFLPDSSIKMNPFSQSFCLTGSNRDKLKIPIKYNSSSELEFLQVQYTDFYNEVTILNYTKKEIKKAMQIDYTEYQKLESNPNDNRVTYMELSFTSPGYYKIHQALDKKFKNIRNYKSDLIIPMCPRAEFSKFDHLKDRCVEDELDDLAITVNGVPPLTLVYEEEINGILSNLPSSIIVPEVEDFKSPLLSRGLYGGQSNQRTFQASELKDLSWATSMSIKVPLANKNIERSGDYIYTVSKIIDGFGNVVHYVPDPSDGNNFYKFKSHPMPLLNLVDSKPHLPILVGQQKYLDLKTSQVGDIGAEAPVTVSFGFIPEDGTEEDEETFTKVFNFRESARIPATKPGTYVLHSAFTKFCSCRIASSSVDVLEARLPQVKISTDPIVDICVGTTGFKFNFEFIGNGPFEVSYKVTNLDPNNSNKVLSVKEVNTLRSTASVLEYIYKPSSEGSYAIEFLSLSDNFYKKQVMFNNQEHRFVTYFKQRPKAYFNKRSNIQRVNVCNGGDADVSLFLEGKPPFKVAYNIISPDYKVDVYSQEEIMETEFKIKTPKFLKGGEYILTLKNVTDATNCGVDFKGQEVHFSVTKDIPRLSYLKSSKHELIQGKKLTIPLKTESSQPCDLTYRWRSLDGSETELRSVRNFDPTQGFDIYEAGFYSLVEFKQGGCPGNITNDFEIEVSHLPKPSLNLVTRDDISIESASVFKRSTICEKYPGSLDFQATGVLPFIIKYAIKFPSGLVEEKSEQVSNKNFAIQLNTFESGDYEYVVHGIYDSIYTSEILKSLETSGKYSFDKLKIKHSVSALPTAKFSEKQESYQTCVSALGDLDKLQPIPITLSGKAPFNVKLSLFHEQEDRFDTFTLEKIEGYQIELYSIYENLNIGSHIVSIIEIEDGNGCISNDFEKEEITVLVNDVPKIRHLIDESTIEHQLLQQSVIGDDSMGSNYYCVGDHITYLLSGVPPFTVYYKFNDNTQRVEVTSNYFKRRASKEGDLSVLALSDSSSKNCLVNFTTPTTEDGNSNKRLDLNAKIYDLPSVEISHGDSIEEDIHEGDNVEIIFNFVGHPPFKLTYVRTDLTEPDRIVETEVVDGIYDYEYRIWAKMEGVYEAVEVQDAYCIARNHRV